MYNSNSPSLLNLIGTLVVFIIAAGYGVMALVTQDATWFVSRFNETPVSMTVMCYGAEVPVTRLSPYFDPLTNMLNSELSDRNKNWDSLSMSDETLEYYQSSPEAVVLITTYKEPVRVPSIYKYFSSVDTLMVPLIGRHAHTNAVFGRAGENTTAGSLHINDTDSLRDYLTNAGLCPIQ